MAFGVVGIAGLLVETPRIVDLGRRVAGEHAEVTDLDDGHPVRRSHV
jgi:hypothetical protein